MMTKRNKTIIIIICIITSLYVIYDVFNYKFDINTVRSSIRLYDPENKNPERQKELINVSYFNNGLEQGTLDASCTSWTCSFNLNDWKFRGNILGPLKIVRINGRWLRTDNKKYYNSGYIKGYSNNCAKHRNDCEEKIEKMNSDYKKYYGEELLDISERNYTILSRNIKTKIENGLGYYSLDNNNFTVIETDKILNNSLPVREKSVGKMIISPNKKFILLEATGIDGITLLIYEVDTKQIYKVLVIPHYGSVEWTSESLLWIKESQENQYLSNNKDNPWVVDKK